MGQSPGVIQVITNQHQEDCQLHPQLPINSANGWWMNPLVGQHSDGSAFFQHLEASTAFADVRVSVGRIYRPIVLMFTYSKGRSYPDSYLQYTRTHINLLGNFPGKVDQHDLEKFGVLIMGQSKSFIMVQIQGVSKRWRMKLEHDLKCTLYTAILFHSATPFLLSQ